MRTVSLGNVAKAHPPVVRLRVGRRDGRSDGQRFGSHVADGPMTSFDLIFEMFALLLGLSIAELLGGLARSWQIRKGAIVTGATAIRIGWLVPLLALLLLIEQSRFWVLAFAVREYLTFNQITLLAILVIVGGYFAISTFVFPDQPRDWPVFDAYFQHSKRTVVGGLILVNLTTLLFAIVLAARGAPIAALPMADNSVSLAAGLIYVPVLGLLWLATSYRASLSLLLLANALLLTMVNAPWLLAQLG